MGNVDDPRQLDVASLIQYLLTWMSLPEMGVWRGAGREAAILAATRVPLVPTIAGQTVSREECKPHQIFSLRAQTEGGARVRKVREGVAMRWKSNLSSAEGKPQKHIQDWLGAVIGR